MTKVKFFIDACASDLNESLVSEFGISLLYPEITFNGQTFPSDCTWRKTSQEEYIEFLHNGGYARISQVSMGEWKDRFESAMKDGYNILFLSLSQRFSGGYKNAYTAKVLLQKDYPDREFEIIDSELAGGGYKLYALKVAEDLRNSHCETLHEFSETVKSRYAKRIQTYWVCPNLNYVTFMARGSDNFEPGQVPKGSPLMATDFKGSFSAVSVNADTECTFKDLLQKLRDIESWEFSYCPDLDNATVCTKVRELTEVTGKAPDHVISCMAPTNIAVSGPYSYGIGVLR